MEMISTIHSLISTSFSASWPRFLWKEISDEQPWLAFTVHVSEFVACGISSAMHDHNQLSQTGHWTISEQKLFQMKSSFVHIIEFGTTTPVIKFQFVLPFIWIIRTYMNNTKNTYAYRGIYEKHFYILSTSFTSKLNGFLFVVWGDTLP
jgi:hypothetical protein